MLRLIEYYECEYRMDDLEKFKTFFKLKSTYRHNNVDSRKESVAEHTWACLVLADFFLPRTGMNIDRLRVYELLIYHDIVEIETGDIPMHPDYDTSNKKQDEKIALIKLKENIPGSMKDRIGALVEEYNEINSIEAKFAKAIDALEVELFLSDSKDDWEGYTKKFVIDKKLKYFEDFPLMKKCFLEILDDIERKGYFLSSRT